MILSLGSWVRGRACAWLAGLAVLLAASPPAAAQITGGSVTASAGAFSPNPVAVGETATAPLSATYTPPSVQPYTCTLSGPTWSWSLDSGAPPGVTIDHPDPSSPDATLIATITTPGYYTISATVTATWTSSCGDSLSLSSTCSAPETVVGVQKLQYACYSGGTFTDVSGTLYAMRGTSITFKAIPTPDGASFPDGRPVWSGTSGATGTGATVSVTFNTLSTNLTDFKTVIATCGTSSQTANVIVFDVTPKLTPQDNFAGRDLDNYGVCELIDLTFETTPAGIAESDIGTLEWFIETGEGTITGSGGSVTYECPETAAYIPFTLSITSLCNSTMKDVYKSVLTPEGFLLDKTSPRERHTMGMVGVGFQADSYATCSRIVSFRRIEVREGGGTAVATGSQAGSNGQQHTPGNWWQLNTYTAGKGYRRAVDTVDTGDQVPLADHTGTFTWPIDQMYRKVGTTGDGRRFTIANHVETYTAAGAATISKGGAGPFTKAVNDPTSGY